MEINRAGFWTLVENSGNKERMHPLGNPLSEGLQIYVKACRLEERLSLTAISPLVLWDVGLGMGANALAAVTEWRRLQAGKLPLRRLEIISFENQFDGFQAVVAEVEKFPHAADPAAVVFAKERSYEEAGLNWRLMEGDFFETSQKAPAPEIIFFDPFSRNTNPRFWEAATFRGILEKTSGKSSILATYANARAVRNAMAEAGWKVSMGPGFGNRNQTTLAVTPTARP